MAAIALGRLFVFFNDTATTEIYTLSLHDALPIREPSGDQRPACASSVGGLTCLRFWPSASTTKIAEGNGSNGPSASFLPKRVNTMCWPSGDQPGSAPPLGAVEFNSTTCPFGMLRIAIRKTSKLSSMLCRTKTTAAPSFDNERAS